MLDLTALLLGLGLTWAFGIALAASLYRLPSAADPPSLAWIAGCGWFVGVFALTLWMRLLSFAGVPLSVPAIAVPLILVGIALCWLVARRDGWTVRGTARDVQQGVLGIDLAGVQRALWLAMLCWLLVRFALLFAEVAWRPLYPWDAWTQWSTKARVWFELRSIAPFVSTAEWMAATTPDVYYDAAPHYPATVPLFQTWSALLIGRWDDALVNLPWWFTGVAFGFGMFGGLIRLGLARIVALAGTSMVLSLPIVDTHVALAGYADLPMACYLTLGALAALDAARTRSASDAALAALLLVACALVKNPGKAWLIVLLPGVFTAMLPKHGLRIAGAAFMAAALVLVVVTRTGVTILGYTMTAQFALPWNALFDAYFSFGNWNLLWYGAVATALLAWRHLLDRDVAPMTCIVVAGLLFLIVGFAFSNAGAWVEDQSTVNRATLHLAPLIVVWMLVALRARFAKPSDASSLPSVAASPPAEAA
jgi:hypothetical protein